jgi:hypothetical protein
MDFAAITKKNTPTTQKQRTVSPKAWTPLNVAIMPTGTIEQRRVDSEAKTTRDIYQQLDFSTEATTRVDEAIQHYDAIDTEFFAKCEAKFASDVGSGRVVDDTEWVWFDSVVPSERVSTKLPTTRDLSPSERAPGESHEDWYLNCDVCGANDYGRYNCGCFHVIKPCTFTQFVLMNGAVVPRQVKNVPVESLCFVRPPADEM